MLDYRFCYIIGAGKCATTSLFAALSANNAISPSKIKEPSFYSMDERWRRGENWYRSLFNSQDPNLFHLDASNSYSNLGQHPDTIRRIQLTCEDPKFVYIVRNPIQRTVADWRHEAHFSGIDIETFLLNSKTWYFKNRYHNVLNLYTAAFGRDSIFLIFFEDLIADPDKTISSLYTFLNITGANLKLPLLGQHQQMRLLPSYIRVVQNSLFAQELSAKCPPLLKKPIQLLLTSKPLPRKPDWTPKAKAHFNALEYNDAQDFLELNGKPTDYWEWKF